MTIASTIMAAALLMALFLPFLARKAGARRAASYVELQRKADAVLAELEAMSDGRQAPRRRAKTVTFVGDTVHWWGDESFQVCYAPIVKKHALLAHSIEIGEMVGPKTVVLSPEENMGQWPHGHWATEAKATAKARRDDVGWQPRACYAVN